MRRVVLTAVAVGGMAMLSACGSNGSHNNNPAVVVSPATMNVQQGSTQQFTATVINSNNRVVNWLVNGIIGGNASVGTVNSTGPYTASFVTPNPPTATVTAVSQANTNVFGSAIVTITTCSTTLRSRATTSSASAALTSTASPSMRWECSRPTATATLPAEKK